MRSGAPGFQTGAPFTDGSEFVLGTFTHDNFPVYGFTPNEFDVDLRVNVVFDDGALIRDFSFRFHHNETPNVGAYPQDLVDLPTLQSPETVELDGEEYALVIAGFKQGGQTVTRFGTAPTAPTSSRSCSSSSGRSRPTCSTRTTPTARSSARAAFSTRARRSRSANEALIADQWDDLLRLAASLKFGQATASLVVGKLPASGPQNTLAAALKEYGLVRRTIYAARYLSDPAYRRRITRQLNKGESLHALRRDLCYAHEGKLRHRHHEGQSEQALCFTVVTNAIVAWTTDYLGLAVAELKASGRQIDDALLAHVSPAHNENIAFYGTFAIEVDRELAQLVGGYRPLRPATP